MFLRTLRCVLPALGLLLITFIAVVNSPLPTAAAQTGPATALPTSQATTDPFAGLSISELAARSYGGGELKNYQVFNRAAGFTRYLISYPSDGLTIYGFMDVPTAPPRSGSTYPVVVAVHGYIDPRMYQTIDYTARYADALATAGFLVLHPNLRNYFPSDKGPNLFRVGYAIDVLNLVAIVRARGGQAGALQQANPSAIGLWGHSMGGGISIRVMTVDPQIRAVVLYSAVSGDERQNASKFPGSLAGRATPPADSIPDDVYQRVSPVSFYDRVQAAVSIHYGLADKTVPPVWSETLCRQLQALQKSVECFSYPKETHIFGGTSDQLFIQRTITFFNTQLRGVLPSSTASAIGVSPTARP